MLNYRRSFQSHSGAMEEGSGYYVPTRIAGTVRTHLSAGFTLHIDPIVPRTREYATPAKITASRLSSACSILACRRVSSASSSRKACFTRLNSLTSFR